MLHLGEIDATEFTDGPLSYPAVLERCTGEPFAWYVGAAYDDTDLAVGGRGRRDAQPTAWRGAGRPTRSIRRPS